ncbi:unnamed protein product, partial [Ectocarpus sp. 12 AP-2014]
QDIASSVPIDITFMDPSAMHWGNRSGNGNSNAGAGAAALGRSASSEGWAGGAAEPVNGGHAAGFSGGGIGAAGVGAGGGAGGGGGGGVGSSGGSMGGGTPAALAKRKVGLDSFKIVRVIGKGSFGKVFLVREKVAGDIYAMKVLRKDNVIKRNQARWQ